MFSCVICCKAVKIMFSNFCSFVPNSCTALYDPYRNYKKRIRIRLKMVGFFQIRVHNPGKQVINGKFITYRYRHIVELSATTSNKQNVPYCMHLYALLATCLFRNKFSDVKRIYFSTVFFTNVTGILSLKKNKNMSIH